MNTDTQGMTIDYWPISQIDNYLVDKYGNKYIQMKREADERTIRKTKKPSRETNL